MKEQLSLLAKGTLIYGVGGILNKIIALLLLPVYTAFLTPGDYGVITVLVLLSLILTPIFSLGLGVSIGICYFEDNQSDRKAATISTAFFVLCVSVLILLTTCILFRAKIGLILFGTTEHDYLIVITLVTSCLGILVQPFSLYLQFEERAKAYVTITVLSALIAAGAGVLLVVVFKKGAAGVIEAILISQIVASLLFTTALLPSLKFTFNRTIARELLNLGIPMVPSFASLFVLQQGNQFILKNYYGLDALGIYSIGYNLGLAMGLLVSGFTSAWPPFFLSYANKKEEAKQHFGHVLLYYLFVFGTISLLFFIWAKPVVMLMTAPAFHESYVVVGFSSTAQFLTGLFSILLPGIYFAKEVKFVSLVQALTALISLGISFLLIPAFGIVGAAMALALSFLIMCIVQYAWNYGRRNTYLRVSYEWKRIGVFTAIYIGYMITMSLPRNFSLTYEIMISVAALASLLLLMYFILNIQERQAVAEEIKLKWRGLVPPANL